MSKLDLTEQVLQREFIGYGYNTPDPKWPGGAKVCVSFVVQYNMGAESSPLNGDEMDCADFLEIPKAQPGKGRNESAEQMYEFGAREGVSRLLRIFNKYQVPVTWNIFTRALEQGAYWVQPILDSGAELSCGGHRYRDNMHVSAEEEEKSIRQGIDILQRLTKNPSSPQGWLVERRSNLSTSLYARIHEEKQLPLVYSSDSCADDLPYWQPSPCNDRGLLMVPYSYDTSDLRFNVRGSGWASPKDWFIYLRDSFDCFEEEGEAGEPKMMTVLLHPHICGRPNRAIWLEEFVKYCQSKGAYIARRVDIAKHWQKHFPYDASTAFGQTKQVECGQIHIKA